MFLIAGKSRKPFQIFTTVAGMLSNHIRLLASGNAREALEFCSSSSSSKYPFDIGRYISSINANEFFFSFTKTRLL